MDATASQGPEPRTVGTRREALPVDPDLPQAERAPEQQQVSPSGGVGRRPARPRLMWGRLARVVVRRRDVLAVIAVGGALGSLGRWGVAEALPHAPGVFAWSTFVTNVSGCFLIGLLMVFVIDVWPPSRHLRPFLGVGVLGGYTT
ncbi:MAG: fluoride efflux transporter FluC, partial [Kineosporiaceae bacterium]